MLKNVLKTLIRENSMYLTHFLHYFNEIHALCIYIGIGTDSLMHNFYLLFKIYKVKIINICCKYNWCVID